MRVQTLTFLMLLISSGVVLGQSARLVVLGITQDAGYPQLGCTKNCCKGLFAEENSVNRVASVAIAGKNKFFILDATPDFTFQFELAQQAFPDHSFGGILLTHAHIGHYTGLMYLGKEAMNSKLLPVFCMPRMKKFLQTNGPWDQLVELENISLKNIADGEKISIDEGLHITPHLVPHRDEYSETVGFEITGEETVWYIPDIDKWSKWDQNLTELIKQSKVVFLDATFFDESELPDRDMSTIPHPFVVETAEELAGLDRTETEKVHLIHFNHTNPLLNPNSEARKHVESLGFTIARTGMSLPF